MNNLPITIAVFPYAAALVDDCFNAEQAQPGDQNVISASQIRAGRALLGIDQKTLAERAGVSLSTIQRMEAGENDPPGVIDMQKKVVSAFRAAGIELIGDHERSGDGGRGVRPTHPVGSIGRTH
jgi:DNA-binding XRE family transcriptional regulator